jgi:hypothetical protein
MLLVPAAAADDDDDEQQPFAFLPVQHGFAIIIFSFFVLYEYS